MLQGRVRHTWPKVTNTYLCELSSYRPISNLSFPTNLFQLVVGVQLTEYLSSAGLLPVHPSIGYRRFHSTETALLKMMTDLKKTINSFIHCRHLYSASSSGTTQKRSQPQRGRIMLF